MSQIADFNTAAGCRVVREFSYEPFQLTQVLEFDDEQTILDKLDQYYKSGLIVYAQFDYLYTANAIPNDKVYDEAPGPQWSLPKISAPQAWDLTTGTPGIIVAVADSGANVAHPDFSTNLWSGQNNGEIHNFVSDTTNVTDDTTSFHGSNVASIAGAQGGNTLYMTGVAWNTSLMILKVLNSAGVATSSDIAAAIAYAWAHGAIAINISIGGYGPYYYNCQYNKECGCTECDGPYLFDQVEFDAINAAKTHGMVTVCAAGNYGGSAFANNDNDANYSPVSPASIPAVNNIAVLATNYTDGLASYSSYGLGRVDLGAPGGETTANKIIGLKQTHNGNSADSVNYSFLYGTSMAAPHVTGALALIKSLFPWEKYSGIRDRVLMGTDTLTSLTGKCRTNGRLDLYKALQTRTMFRNLSTRARVESGDKIMIGGFTIGGSGTGTLKVALRGLGPSLDPYLTVPVLANPKLTLKNSAGTTITSNDNWINMPSGQKTDFINAGLDELNGASISSVESGIVWTLAPGSYTVFVESNNGTSFGVGLFEIYEFEGGLDQQARLLNLSTRCLVRTGEEEAIAGTILGSGASANLPKPNRRILMLGKGPSLPLTGKLLNPLLDVVSTGEMNDNWGTMYLPLREELANAGFSPTQTAESALWPTFTPGSYTFRLRGVSSTTGIGLIELYEF